MSDRTTKTIESYNKNGNRYADKFMDYPTYGEKIRQFCHRYITDGSSVLDLGCGPGNNGSIIMNQNKNLKLIGYDLSETMVEIARSAVPEAQFEILNINELNTDTLFDVVIASFCIVHLSSEETETLVRKIAEILPVGGTLFLSCMEGKNPGFETTCFSESKIWFNYFDREWLTDLLENNGIEISEFAAEGYPEPDGSVTTDLFFFGRRV